MMRTRRRVGGKRLADQTDESQRPPRLAGGVEWIRRSETRWKYLKFVCQTGGGALAGWGGGMGGDLLTQGSPTWKLVILLSGLALIAVGAIMTLFDRDPADAAKLAAECEEEKSRAATLMRERDANAAAIQRLTQDLNTLAQGTQLKIAAHQVLMQAVETASLMDAKTDAKIQTLLNISIGPVLKTLGLGLDADWTISVFQRRKHRKNEAMVRVAHRWLNETDAKNDRRFWCKGEGYTGHVWATRRPVVVHDAQSPEARKTYDVPAAKRILKNDPKGIRPDVHRYVSVAAFPIRIGPANPNDPDWQPWGVVTVTTDRSGTFSHDDDVSGGENREIVRYLASLIALIVAGNVGFTANG
jgi:hypothetical protein